MSVARKAIPSRFDPTRYLLGFWFWELPDKRGSLLAGPDDLPSMLMKPTVIAIQHANQTGNYTVLRDLGTPVFWERFDPTRLAAIFGNLRARGINLSPVLMLSPNLDRPAELMDRRRLRLAGSFPTQPLQIRYELVFLQIDGVWRVDGLAVDAVARSAATGAASKSAIGWKTKTKS